MSTYKKILLLVDPAIRETKGLRRAQHLAWMEGAELHLCLVDYSAAIEAVGPLKQEVMALAKRAFIEEREQWLKAQAASIESSGIEVHTAMIWGHPTHEKALAKIIAVQPDLVIKDVAHEPLLKRALFTSLDTQLLRLCPCPLLLIRGAAADPPKHILAAVDVAHPAAGVEEFNAHIVEAARGLADNCKASLDLVYAFENLPTFATAPATVDADAYSKIGEELRDMQTQDFSDFARRQGFAQEHTLLLSGTPAQAIIDYTAQAKVDVVVVGTVYHAALDRFMLGSTAEALLHGLACDVLVVKPKNFIERLNDSLAELKAKPSQPGGTKKWPQVGAMPDLGD